MQVTVGSTTYRLSAAALAARGNPEVTFEDVFAPAAPAASVTARVPAGFTLGQGLELISPASRLAGITVTPNSAADDFDSSKEAKVEFTYNGTALGATLTYDGETYTTAATLAAGPNTGVAFTNAGKTVTLDISNVPAFGGLVRGDSLTYVAPKAGTTNALFKEIGRYATQEEYKQVRFTSDNAAKDAEITLRVNNVDAVTGEATFDVFVDGSRVTTGGPYKMSATSDTWTIDGIGTFKVGLNGLDPSKMSVGDELTYSVKKASSGTRTATNSLSRYLAENLTLDITNTASNGLHLQAKVANVDTTAGTVTLNVLDSTDATRGTLTFNLSDGSLVSETLSTQPGSTLTVRGSTRFSSPINPAKLAEGLTLDFDVQGIGNSVTATILSPGNAAMATAYNSALANAQVILTDEHGNQLNQFMFNIVRPGTTGNDYHISALTNVRDLEGNLVTFTSLPGYALDLTSGDAFTTVDDDNGNRYTLSITGFTAGSIGATANSTATITSIPNAGTWTRDSDAFEGASGPLAVTITPDSNFDPSQDAEVIFKTDASTPASWNDVHFEVRYGNATSGDILYASGPMDVTVGGVEFRIALPTTETVPAVNQTAIYTFNPSAPGTTNSYKAAADYAQDIDYSNVRFTTDNAVRDAKVELRVNNVNETNGEVTFDVFVDGEAVTLPNSVMSASDSTWIISGLGTFSVGLGSLDLSRVAEGDTLRFDVLGPDTAVATSRLVGRYGTTQEINLDASAADKNASILLEVEKVDNTTKSVIFKATANLLDTSGNVSTRVTSLRLTDTSFLSVNNDLDIALKLGLDLSAIPAGKKLTDVFKEGDKLVYNVTAAAPKTEDSTVKVIDIDGQQNQGWDGSWGASVTNGATSLKYAVDTSEVNGQEVHFKNFYVNEKDGTVYAGDIILDLAKDFDIKVADFEAGTLLASFEATYIGQVAKSDVKLEDLDKFWNSEGRFLLADAQKLTITQGDGTTATVTLYATDTLQDAATKLNQAIASQLGQKRLLTTDGQDGAADSFVTFVDEKIEGTSESTPGTFLIRSAIAGANGKVSFAGDEELLNALSMNQIQAAEENSFTVSVWDAHSGKSVASGVKITGNKLIGVVNENVDVEFDSMANVKVEWNDKTKSYTLSKDTGSSQTLVHLADNTTVFQIGANEGEDMGINIGDMRASALGLNSVLVTDRESAARSITIIDNAIDKVSTQRARLGAYQNRLEHTITNLTVAGENLTAAESRIRDTDMAKEMMNFTKLQIMLQAGTSMLAQANTLPQNVLSLLR
jgi:flagellin